MVAGQTFLMNIRGLALGASIAHLAPEPMNRAGFALRRHVAIEKQQFNPT